MVLANNKLIDDQIKQHHRKLIGIDMETYGVYYTSIHCSKPRPVAISIKSISDFGDSKKDDSHKEYAAYTSANFFYNFVLEEL